MATRSLGSLTLDLIAKVGGFTQGMDKAARDAARAAEKIERENKRRAEATAKAWEGVRNVIGGIAIAQIGRELITIADTYQNLNARIGLVTRSAAQQNEVLEATFRIAQDTRQSFEQTGLLYVRLAQATEQLGVSQADTLAVTDTINRAFVVSGTSAASAAAAIVQLGQGFASGVLRGEELNSVLEQAPRLAKAIADGLGVNVGQLRKLGEEGALTADKVFAAILSQQAALQEEFRKLPPTVEQSLVQVGNSITRLIGKINEATGATSLIAAGFASVARGIDALAGSDQLTSLTNRLNDLQTRRVAAAQGIFGIDSQKVKELDREIASVQGRIREIREGAANNQFSAESARLARSGNRSGGAPQVDSVENLRARIRELSKLRDQAAVGSEAFKKYTAEVGALESRLKSLTGTVGGGGGGRRSADDPAARLLESLREQAVRIEEVTTLERTRRELEKAEFAKISPQRRQEILDAAELIDKLEEQKQIKTELAKADEERIKNSRQAAIDELEAITKANESYQDYIDNLINATPTRELERQRKTVQDLSDEYLRGRFGIVGSEEAVRLYGETVNTFLGNTADQLAQTRSIGDELGLTFQSAFEDAIVEGKNLGDVLKALEQDIIRLVTRQLVTNPIADAISGAVKGIGGSGGGIGGFINGAIDAVSGFLGFRAKGGPVASRGLYRVNENGPELLSFGGKDYLMMGAQGGTVSPSGKGNQLVHINVAPPPNMSRESANQFALDLARKVNAATRKNS